MDPQLINDFLRDFSSILWEAFPFIVLGALIAGILEEVVPQEAIQRIIPKNRFLAAVLGGSLGMIFPMCECGIVVVMRRLLRKGLPLGTCVAYLLAGPVVNVVVILSTAVAFGGHGYAVEMVGMRVGMAFLVAVVTGVIVEGLERRVGRDELVLSLGTQPTESTGKEKKSLWTRLNTISSTAIHDFVDIMVFLILGALLAASVKLFLDMGTLADASKDFFPLAILAMMGVSVVLCLCSEADAFVAASFTTLHPSAKLSFLVLGPMFDIKLFLMYTRVFRRRLIVTVFSAVVIQVFIYSVLAHLLWEALDWQKVSELNSSSAS